MAAPNNQYYQPQQQQQQQQQQQPYPQRPSYTPLPADPNGVKPEISWVKVVVLIATAIGVCIFLALLVRILGSIVWALSEPPPEDLIPPQYFRALIWGLSIGLLFGILFRLARKL